MCRRSGDQVSEEEPGPGLRLRQTDNTVTELQSDNHVRVAELSVLTWCSEERIIVKWLGDIFLAIVICGEEINDVISISV